MVRRFLVSVLSVLMVLSIMASVRAMPPITDKLHLKVATIEGESPETVDPAWCYDTASGELIFNVYDTLITFDGEHMDRYLPSIAENWTIQQINETSPEGLHWYYRYTFQIRPGVKFYDTLGHVYDLTPQDVEFSFEREMVQDRAGGPQWMFYEPLLNGKEADYINGVSYNLTNTADIIKVGEMIDHAVESNSTHVWFNLAFPGAYPQFIQILCQSWSSILSKQWINNYVIGELGRKDWPGDWGDYTGWINYHSPGVSPLDNPTPIMCGSGPFMLETLNYTDQYWTIVRNVNYWRGWPADFPKIGPTAPAGWVDRVTVTWKYTWEDRKTMFLAGDLDIVAVPRMYIPEMYKDYSMGILQDGIRCIYPLPLLCVNVVFGFNHYVASSDFQKVYPCGTFAEDGIPADFFGNSNWGMYIRKAFAYAFDYNRYNQEVYYGEAFNSATAIIPGQPYYDPSVKGYCFNLTKAEEYFKIVPGLWETGFTLTILYFTGNIKLQIAAEILRDNIALLNNPKFHIEIASTDWKSFLRACGPYWYTYLALNLFIPGWCLDYSDPYNVVYPFYHSGGMFATLIAYSNPEMDILIDDAAKTVNETERAKIFKEIQELAVEDCPYIGFYTPFYRHFERSWVVGWYYNPIYPGEYAYNIWKWYYVPHALLDTSTQPTSSLLPYDVNYDGKVDIKDVSTTAKSFGATPGPPIHPRWVFRCDFNNDRKIDIKDVSAVAKSFGKTSTPWTYP